MIRHMIAICALTTTFALVGLRPGHSAEFNFREQVAAIPQTIKALPGRPVGTDELVTLIRQYPKEVGRIIAATREDFGPSGMTYRINHIFDDSGTPSGSVRYSDGRFGSNSGNFLIRNSSDGNSGDQAAMCRAPGVQNIIERCHDIFQINDNLYEARGVSSGKVRYRFMLVGNDSIEATSDDEAMEQQSMTAKPEPAN